MYRDDVILLLYLSLIYRISRLIMIFVHIFQYLFAFMRQLPLPHSEGNKRISLKNRAVHIYDTTLIYIPNKTGNVRIT
jgi:hypothetical protein